VRFLVDVDRRLLLALHDPGTKSNGRRVGSTGSPRAAWSRIMSSLMAGAAASASGLASGT
jgi:hypothetical protein